MSRYATSLVFAVLMFVLIASRVPAAVYAYDGRVTHDVKRDRIIAIAEDYATLDYYVGPANINYSARPGATCPDPTVGWKTGVKYCWGGQDTTAIYLRRLSEGDGPGNKDTSGSSSYDDYCAGVDCSGMASVCWTSPRYATSGFPNISDDILWENLRMGDCTNDAGSHIRVFDHYAGDANTLVFYESTSGGGTLWKAVHRSLARDNIYQPIRYRSTYKVYDFPEPAISYVRRTGIERVEIRWDGQADTGFRLYQSADGTAWTMIRNETALPKTMRFCEVSGLLADSTVYFRMTAQNAAGETLPSAVVPVRLDGFVPRVLLVDGADRFREQFAANHTFLTRVGTSLASAGVGFDYAANEAVVDEQITLTAYEAAIWILAEESTFDETFSRAEQRHAMTYLAGGGRLFVSGSEIGWDIDSRANSTTYKNGHVNDRPFYNKYLRAQYVADSAGTYLVTGNTGSIFEGLGFFFDNGTHGTYNVQTPDVINPINGSIPGMTYQGGTGGTACVYASDSTSGTLVNLAVGFETLYPDASRNAVLNAVMKYFDIPVVAPTLKSVVQTAPGTVTVAWDGNASVGFRLFQKTGTGSWTQIAHEGELGPGARSAVVPGLATGTRYAFKAQAVNSGGPSPDSDVCCALPTSGTWKALVVDGYDRYNAQHSGANHTLVENFADALGVNTAPFDSCANEKVTDGTIALSSYNVVLWMCGEESTESETFGAAEQVLVLDYLKAGGRLFVSGAEIGWDLVARANTLNTYSNGSATDTPFFQNCLKAGFVNDSAATHAVAGLPGSILEGLSFNLDDGTHGTYNVQTPDVISVTGGSVACLGYGAGTDVAGLCYTGVLAGGSATGQVVYFGFPFETIYAASTRASVMQRVLAYFGYPAMGVGDWIVY